MRLSGKLQFDAFNTGLTTKNTKITKGKCTFFFILSGPSWLCMPHLGFLHNHKIKILPRRPQRTQRMLFKELLSRPFLNFVSFVVIKTKPLRHERSLKSSRSHLKNRILVQDRGGAEFQTAGNLWVVEDLKRGPNKDMGPKDIFEMASILKRPQPPRQPSPIAVPWPAAVWLCAFLFRHPMAK